MEILPIICILQLLLLITIPILMTVLFIQIFDLKSEIRSMKQLLAEKPRKAAEPKADTSSQQTNPTPVKTVVIEKTACHNPTQYTDNSPTSPDIRAEEDVTHQAEIQPKEPTAVELFWKKCVDWLLVRGEFAPQGMAHEFAFATRWLVRIGALLIIGSLIYLAKLSVDRGWMGPTGRVALILLLGAAGVATGAALVKRTSYALIGHALAALGIVALYLGFGLGHRFFDPPVIASATLAFSALIGVTICAGVTSICLYSSPIAVLGLVGGYLVPVIAGRDSGAPLGLYVYLLILNIGTFAIARMRKWSALDFLASLFGFALCFIWCDQHDLESGAKLWESFSFITCVHLLYMASVIAGAKFRNRAGNALAWTGLSLGACIYLTWIVIFFRNNLSGSATGIAILCVVAVYLAVAVAALRRGWADRQTVNILLIFALAFLALAPFFIFDKTWLTVIWSVLAVAIMEAEIRTRQKVLVVMAHLVLIAAALIGVFYIAPVEYHDAWISTDCTGTQYSLEVLLRIAKIVALPVATAWIGIRRNLKVITIIACVAVFICYTCESAIFGHVFFPSFGSSMITIAWAIVAFAAIWVGISRKMRALRITSLVLLGITVVKLLLVDTAHLPTPARVGIFAAVGVILLVGAFLYLKSKDKFEIHE